MDSHCWKHVSPFILVCALLSKHMNFKFSSALEKQLESFQRQSEPGGPAVQSHASLLGRQIAGSCQYTQTTQAGDVFHVFPSARCPLLPLGRCSSCQPVQAECLLWKKGCSVGGGEGLNWGPSDVLRISATPWETATSLNAFWLLCPQLGSLLLPKAMLAVAHLAWSTGYPRAVYTLPGYQCPVQGAARLLCGRDFHGVSLEPIWFQTQVLHHLIYIFLHLRVPG